MLPRRRLALTAVALGFGWAFGAGCTHQKDSLTQDHVFVMPSKDDVAVVDGRPFTLTTFMSLRSRLKSQSVESVFWAGTALISLQNEGASQGQTVPGETALSIVRYALGEVPLEEARKDLEVFFKSGGGALSPQQVRIQLDRLLMRSVIQRNPQVLAHL